MYNKIFQAIIFLVCTLGILACTQTSSKSSLAKKRRLTDVAISDGNIILSNESKQFFNLQIKLDDGIIYKMDIKANQQTTLLNLLKANKDFYFDIALMLAQNDGDININLNIKEVLDTTITYHLDLKDASQYSTKVLQGKCANLSGIFDATNVEKDIIKWLYRNNHKNVSDETINNMRLYLQELNRSKFKEYITKEAIPVVTSFQGISYKITADLVADNYYLFACKTEKEIENFVEEMISIKFDGAVHTLNQTLSCYRDESTCGTICVFLIGIDNDWNYRIAPVGLVCIDNVKPSLFPSGKFVNSDIILNKNKIVIKMPDNVPTIKGFASLYTQDFGGNGIKCKVNFRLEFDGDIRSVTIVREGTLTYDNGMPWGLNSERKIINIQNEKSPILFDYELHLEEGDNYVPVIVTDLRGNKTEFKMNIPATFTRRESPDINIENNIFN